MTEEQAEHLLELLIQLDLSVTRIGAILVVWILFWVISLAVGAD